MPLFGRGRKYEDGSAFIAPTLCSVCRCLAERSSSKMTSSRYSFILWKVEIVCWCDGNNELRKSGDYTDYHDWVWGSPEIKDLLEQFCQKKRFYDLP